MKYILCRSMFFILLPVFFFAQAPDTLWTRAYGGVNYDEGYSVHQTFDGGYIIAGFTEDFGGGLRNVWLVKTDSLGDTLWTNTFGDDGWSFGTCVQQTSDGGYILTGGVGDLSLVTDVYLVKTDSNGDSVWSKRFGEAEYDEGNCVEQTSDGGYIVVGITESFGAGYADLYAIRTDADGDTLWTHTYGGALWDEGYAVQQTADSGFIIAGYMTMSSGPGGPDYDVYLIKTAADGDTIWTQTYGVHDGEYRDQGYSVQQTSDGGYIVVGETWYPGTPAWEIDVYLIKTDANGDTLWTRLYDRIERTDVGRSVQQTADGGYIVAGYTSLISVNYDMYLIKTDSNGDTLWTQTYGGPERDEAWDVQQTEDGGYIITGRTDSYGAGGRDLWLVKTEPDIGIRENGGISVRNNNYTTTIFSGPLMLPDGKNCTVFDITGRVVKPTNITRGIYFVEIDDKIIQKVIKIK